LGKEFKAKPTQVIPEICALGLAGLLTYSLRAANVPIESITMFPETTGGITLNVVIFVILMAAAGLMMYLFVKYGLKRVVRYLINVAMFALVFFLFWWFGALYADRLPAILNPDGPVWLLLSLLASLALGLVVYRSKGLMHLVGLVVVGGLTGTFLGVSIPTLTAMALLLALAAYDLFAVYKGPIGKMAQSTDIEEFTGAVFTYGDLTVGMGDMVFYAMLASNSMMNFGPVPFLAASVGVVAGAFLGFKMLEGRDMFPGLPFAVILGLGLMYVTYQVVLFMNLA